MGLIFEILCRVGIAHRQYLKLLNKIVEEKAHADNSFIGTFG